MIIIITTSSEVDKKGFLKKLISREELEGISGLITTEEISDGRRIGFNLIDVADSENFVAMANYCNKGMESENMIGNFCVYPDLIDDFVYDLRLTDIVLIDEIGPMQDVSQGFRELVTEVIGGKDVFLIATIFNANVNFAKKFKQIKGALFLGLTKTNEKWLPALVGKLKEYSFAYDKLPFDKKNSFNLALGQTSLNDNADLSKMLAIISKHFN